MEIVTPTNWVGKTIIELNLRAKYDITVLAVKTTSGLKVMPSPNYKMQEKNILIIIGNTDKIGDIILHD